MIVSELILELIKMQPETVIKIHELDHDRLLSLGSNIAVEYHKATNQCYIVVQTGEGEK